MLLRRFAGVAVAVMLAALACGADAADVSGVTTLRVGDSIDPLPLLAAIEHGELQAPEYRDRTRPLRQRGPRMSPR